MRELLVVALVGLFSVAALLRPTIGLYGYVWFALMRPDYLSWSQDKFPYSVVLAATTLIGSIRGLSSGVRVLQCPVSRWLLLLHVPIVLSAVLAINPHLSMDAYYEFVRMTAMALMIPILIDRLDQFRILFLVIAFSVGFIGLKFGVWSFVGGGIRFTEGLGGFMSDNNTLALAVAMGAPLCWYARTVVSGRIAKLMYLSFLFGCVITVLSSHSRGGALALVSALAMLAWRSQHRLRTLLLTALLLLPPLYLLRDTYFARLSSIGDSAEDGSVAARIAYAKAAIAMWRDYPMVGVGFGSQNEMALIQSYLDQEFTTGPQVIHNTYLQMLVDSGIFAFLIHCGLLFSTIVWLGRAAKQLKDSCPDLECYPRALQASLMAFLVGSTFLSRVNVDFYYIVLMASASWWSIEHSLVAEHAKLKPLVNFTPIES